MREIKFRAWDSKENRWKYPVWDITNDLNKNSQNYLISQFTGLQDKNGIDIYEGDELFVPYNYIGAVEVKYLQDKCKYNISNYDISECYILNENK